MKKKELFFILSLLFLSALFWGGLEMFGSRSAPTIRITVDGEEYGVYSLAKNKVITIGDTNVCEIKNGYVQMISATCPDQLCIQQGAIGDRGGVIVCLPNRVVIEGGNTASSAPDEPQIDAVS